MGMVNGADMAPSLRENHISCEDQFKQVIPREMLPWNGVLWELGD